MRSSNVITDDTPIKRRKFDSATLLSSEDLEAKSKLNDDSDENNPEPPQNAPIPPVANDEDWIRSRTSRLLGLVNDDEEDLNSGNIAHEKDYTERRGAGRAIDEVDTILVETEEDKEEFIAPEITEASPPAKEEAHHGSSRLFVRNLPYAATEEDVRAHFQASEQGAVDEVSTIFITDVSWT